MARSDLLVSLVKAGVVGDRSTLKRTVEAMIAEERGKQHNVFADRLTKALHAPQPTNGTGLIPRPDATLEPASVNRAKDALQEVIPRRRIDDLVLPEACLGAVRQLIEEQVRADLLRSHSLQPRHKVLLVGPPGNGKTSLAEGIAESLSIPLFVVRYDTIIGSYLGETATRLRRVFDYARTTPCVLFFDEFDAVGKERGDLHETGEIKRVVTSLLLQIDDLPSYTVVIAATNHEELLDRAAWRRFELRIELPQPTEKELATYLAMYLDDLALGDSPATLAKSLGASNYAEAEQFCLNVRRRMVLSLGELSADDALQAAMAEWKMNKGTVAKSRAKKSG